MDENKISIIIPAYNAEKYIERAVNSVKNQDYDDWEIIIVENGSTDNTFKICESFLPDSRIKLFRSEKGVSNARNLGIDNASGKWVLFLDADDWLCNEALSVFWDSVNNLNVDIASARYDHNKIDVSRNVIVEYDDVNKYLIECLLNPTQKCDVKAVLFNKQFLIDNNISFNNKLTYAEDSVFLIGVIACNPKVVDIEKKVYHSFVNMNSTVRTANTGVENKYSKAIYEIKKLLKNTDGEIKNAVEIFVLNQLLVILVNDIFRNNNFFGALKRTKILCLKSPYKEAIKKAKIKNIDFTKKIVFLLLKNRLYFLVGIIIMIRRIQNLNRYKKDKE